MKKEDLQFLVPMIVAVLALAGCAYLRGYIDAGKDFHRQAIHRGLATYDQNGEFQWIKK